MRSSILTVFQMAIIPLQAETTSYFKRNLRHSAPSFQEIFDIHGNFGRKHKNTDENSATFPLTLG